jgi:hypothetical protein
MIVRLLTALALVATGLLAGALAYGSIVVRGAFYAVPPDVHLAYRAEFIRHNTPLMPAVTAISIVLCALLAVVVRDRLARGCAAGAAALTLTCVVISSLGNIPINHQIQSWSPAAPPADYLAILTRWDLYHDLRTLAVVGSFLLVVLFAAGLGRDAAAGSATAARSELVPR